MSGSSSSSTTQPFYKRKYDMAKYLANGDPVTLLPEDLETLSGWTQITEVKKDMWEDSQSIIDQKNKKREFYVEYEKEPILCDNGKYRLTITMLHVDRRGFTYTAEHEDKAMLNRNFWPEVEYLIAIYFSPKIKTAPKPPLEDKRSQDDVTQDKMDHMGYVL